MIPNANFFWISQKIILLLWPKLQSESFQDTEYFWIQTRSKLKSVTCKEIGSPYLQLEVKLVVHGVDGLFFQ